MKDYLLDIVEHTYSLGFINMLKVTGDDNKTVINGLAEDRSVILQAEFHNPVPEFMGTFGMPNLGTLNTILRIPEYAENAKISIKTQERNGSEIPSGIHFENAAGDFQNDYRFMTAEMASEKVKSVTMKNVNWNVEFSPTAASIQRLAMQISANADETVFVAKTNNDHLEFSFGDPSTHAGSFVFQHDVGGSVKQGWAWPVEQISKILRLSGDITYKISDDGVTEIAVDSGLGMYRYLLPAQSK